MLVSYMFDDFSFMFVIDQLVQNYLGWFGVYVVLVLFMIIGYGIWVLVVGGVVWGLCFMLYWGEDCIMCGIFLFIVMVLVLVYVMLLILFVGWM